MFVVANFQIFETIKDPQCICFIYDSWGLLVGFSKLKNTNQDMYLKMSRSMSHRRVVTRTRFIKKNAR
jgi:hypothetical protein